MTDCLTPTEVTEWCDATPERAEATRGPGCYALELWQPGSDEETVRAEWDLAFDAPPPDGFIQRLASAERFCYVGSHGKNVYERLLQHAKGHKSASIMQAWPPVAVVDVWTREEPGDVEWSYALDVMDEETVAWTDGTYF